MRGGAATGRVGGAEAMRLMTLGRARAIAGSLGFPSKMPGSSYGLPVRACQAGEKLARVEGSACRIDLGKFCWSPDIRHVAYAAH